MGANSRIVNCSRSPKAITTITIKFDIHGTHSEIDTFKSHIQVYLKDRPRIWAGGLLHFRNNGINFDKRCVEYVLRAQHVKSWQEMAPIMVQKGELDRKCTEVAKKLKIAFSSASDNVDVNIMNDKVKKLIIP